LSNGCSILTTNWVTAVPHGSAHVARLVAHAVTM